MTTLHEIVNTNRPKYTPAAGIVCKDGFRISVQASATHYSLDANGDRFLIGEGVPALPFASVECGFPSELPEPWATWATFAEDEAEPTGTVYGYVPVPLVADLIERHGGEA